MNIYMQNFKLDLIEIQITLNNTTGQFWWKLELSLEYHFSLKEIYINKLRRLNNMTLIFFIGTNGINITNDFSFNGFIGTGTFAFESEAVGVLGRNTVIPGLLTIQNTENQASIISIMVRNR